MTDDIRDLYQSIVLERSRRPRHARPLDPADARGTGNNPMCGDRVEVMLRFAPDGTVAEAAFEARGCAISMACADLMTELAPGRDAHALRALAAAFEKLARTGETADAALDSLKPLSGVADYPSRIRCATLPWSALVSALDGAEQEAA